MLQMKLRDYFKQIATLVEAGEYAAAIQYLYRVLQQYPRFVIGYLLLGRALIETGHYSEASRQFRRVLGADPESVSAHVGLSRAFRQAREWDKAVWHLQLAHELSPQNPELRQEYAQAVRAHGGGTTSPSGITRTALGRIYFSNRLYAKAVRELRNVLAVTPNRLDVQVTLAQVLWQDNQQSEAMQLCQTILGQLPLALKPNLILAAARLESPRPYEATPFLELAHSLDPLGLVSNQFVPGNSWWGTDAEISFPDGKPSTADIEEEAGFWQEAKQMSNRNRDSYEVPDWLRGVGDDLLGDNQPETPTPSAETMEKDVLPDWLQNLVTRVEEVEVSLAGDEVKEDVTFEEEASVTVTSAAEEAAEEASDLPVWLADAQTGRAEAEVVDTSPAVTFPPEVEEEQNGLPDWLQVTNPPKTQPAEDQEQKKKLPDWLLAVEEVEAADSDEIEQLPEWLREEAEEEAAPVDTSKPERQEEALASEPVAPTQQQPEDEKLDLEAAQSLDVPIPNEKQPLMEESEISIWLTGESGPTSLQLSEADENELEAEELNTEIEAEVPDWLRELRQPAASGLELSTATSPPEANGEDESVETEDSDMPVWLKRIREGATEEEIEEEEDISSILLSETLSADVEEVEGEEDSYLELELDEDEPDMDEVVLDPAWEEAMTQPEEPPAGAEAGDTKAEAEEVASEAVVEAPDAGIDEVEAALEREARDAVEIAELPEDAEERLEVARQAAIAGNWVQALAIYDSLVDSSELLNKVIDDLEVSVQSHPDDTAVYQLLGDAYMKDGRLPSALKTYRKALTKLS